MTMFAESGGVLGIDCEGCGRQVSGAFRSYRDLLRASEDWTLTFCPVCRPERASVTRFAATQGERPEGLRRTA
jgi:hypothetical protein